MNKNKKLASGKFNYQIANYKNFKKILIKIKPSKRFGGIGVFAVRKLKAGTIIGNLDLLGEDLFYAWKDFKKIDKKSQKIINDFCVSSDQGFYSPKDLNYLSIPWHMNHCCDGNVGFDSIGNFITIKNVKEGNELCYDYGLVFTNSNYKLKCICKSKNCRKIITGNDWKNEKFRRKNIKYIFPEQKNLIK
jgi:hypothetical protein